MAVCVVFDCETDSKPPSCRERGATDFSFVQCTCACALEIDLSAVQVVPSAAQVASTAQLLSSAKKLTCWRDVIASRGANPFAPLLALFDSADIIVGFNALDFDFPLLKRHYGKMGLQRYYSHRFKCIDVFERVRSATGSWPSLDGLLSLNNLGSKSGSGAFAITLWNEGRRAELEHYCQDDVRLTAELAMLPRLRVLTKTGETVSVPGNVYSVAPALYALMAARAQKHPNFPAVKSRKTSQVQSAPPTDADDEPDYVMVGAVVQVA